MSRIGWRAAFVSVVTGALVAAGLAAAPPARAESWGNGPADHSRATSDATAVATARTWPVVEMISRASDNTTPAGSESTVIAASPDGRLVVFDSPAATLVPGDTNNTRDVFVRDRLTNTIERVSLADDGSQVVSNASARDMSEDGRYVVFTAGPGFVEGAPGGVHVRDREAGRTEWIADGTLPTISRDGRWVAFITSSALDEQDTNNTADVYLHDRQTGTTTLVSVTPEGVSGNSSSVAPHLSGDGRYVVFDSLATDLVPGDNNNRADIFVRDVVAGTTELVSVATDGTQADESSQQARITPDGRWVTFLSTATNLVPGDTNGVEDIFVRDLVNGTTERVSVASDGTEGDGVSSGPRISDDGRYVSFRTFAALDPDDSNGELDVYVRDRIGGSTTRVSVGSGGASGSWWGWVTGDGRHVLLDSYEPLLGVDTRGVRTSYAAGPAWPHNTGLPGVTGTPEPGATLTAVDGSWAHEPTSLTYQWQRCGTDGANCVDIAGATSADYRVARLGDGTKVRVVVSATNDHGTTRATSAAVEVTGVRTWPVSELLSRASDNATPADGAATEPVTTPDGRFVVFTSDAANLVPGDTNGAADVFVRDRLTSTLERVSVASDGTEADAGSTAPDISDDGRWVVFRSDATNLGGGAGGVFLHDRQTGTTERLADGEAPAISGDGRRVAFHTGHALDDADTNDAADVYVLDRGTGTTTLVSVTPDGVAGDGDSTSADLGGDGRYVAFQSLASNLVAGDGNDAVDVFVRDLETGTTERVSVATDGTEGSGHDPRITADGRYVAFVSNAATLVDGDTNDAADVFVRDREAGVTERVSVATDGTQGTTGAGEPSISDDGRWIAFVTADRLDEDDSDGDDDLYVRDRVGELTTRVSVGPDGASGATTGWLAGDGRHVVMAGPARLHPLDINGAGKLVAAGPAWPANIGLPGIDGTPLVGQTLVAHSGTWENSPTGLDRQWQRCDARGAACTDIPGATGATYTPANKDLGATLRLVVTATNDHATTRAFSAVTVPVTAETGTPPDPADLGPVTPGVDPGCRYTAASADAATANGQVHGFAQFSGTGCANDGRIVWFTQAADGGDGSDAVTEVTPWAGRVLAVDATEYATFLLYVTPQGQVRITSRLADGTYTGGRALVSLGAAKARLVTGTVAARGSEWRAVWSEGGNQLYEARNFAGVSFNRHAIAGAHTRLKGTSSQPDLALRSGTQATLTFIGPDGRVWVAPTSGKVKVGNTTTEGWATRAFELAPRRAEGYADPRVAVDGPHTYLAWTARRAKPGPYITAADNTSGTWASRTFNTLGDRVRLAVEGGRVRVAWATAQAKGVPARVFIARRDSAVGAWAGEYASPAASTDQVPVALTIADGLTTLVLRSPLRLYTRVHGELPG